MATDELSVTCRAGDATLLLTPPFADVSNYCTRMGVPLENTPENVLLVTLTGTADECLNRWRSRLGPNSNLGVVCVSPSTRSAATNERSAIPGGYVRGISSPEDLTGLAIAISGFLTDWEDAEGTQLCFDSITPLLNYGETQRIFRFLHVLISRLQKADVAAHFHMDPTAHDETTVRSITSLFDWTADIGDQSPSDGVRAVDD